MSSTQKLPFYATPSYQAGGSCVVFSNARRQRGGSLFSSLKNQMAPSGRGPLRGAAMAGRQMMKGARYAARNEAVREIAKQALQKGT